jgi:hypothetical protein
MKNFDPTIEELRALIRVKFAKLLDEETLNSSGEIAIHYFASDYYDGQWSNLYRAICEVNYSPSILNKRGILDEEDECIWMIYNKLLDQYDPESENYIVDETTGEAY